MIHHNRPRSVIALLILGGALVGGCETDFIEEQALEAFASFVTGVVTEAVDETIRP